MKTKYIVNNLSGQTITGDLNVTGNIKQNGFDVRPYKVYTSLLTQSGGYGPSDQTGGDLTIGVSYEIVDNGGSGWDFTNVGAPNNDIGTFFVATEATPNSWGIDGQLNYNEGTPIVHVLENTIGNIWFEYSGEGMYTARSNGLFTEKKVYTNLQFWGDDNATPRPSYTLWSSSSVIEINSGDIQGTPKNGIGQGGTNFSYLTSIEIRVYN